ncbi:hypothetical protein AMTRI_Chr08g206360 [Amborella trichopoda]
MHIVLNRPQFVLDCMPKVSNRPYFPKVLDRSYFVPERMLSRNKVTDCLHFVLDHMFFRGYFGLYFTFSMT